MSYNVILLCELRHLKEKIKSIKMLKKHKNDHKVLYDHTL